MTKSGADAFEAFLVEDVILTLGSIRGAIGWLSSGQDCPPAQRAEAFARIARQATALEDRARLLWRRIQAQPAPDGGEVEGMGNLFAAPGGEACPPRRAVFRSHRAAP